MLIFHSFADFKKRIRVGMRFQVDHHTRPNAAGRREISRVQTNALAAWFTDAEGKRTETWCRYPKSGSVRVTVSHEGSRITFLDDHGAPAFTYHSFQEA